MNNKDKLERTIGQDSLEFIGKSVTRIDGYGKVTGQAKYVDDFFEHNMLVGKVLRSPYAHAEVKKIDVAKAKALPGVEAVITYDDIPHILYASPGHPYALHGNGDKEDRLILTNKARFVGDGIAAVVAESELICKKALKLIEVEYEVLPAIFTIEDALKGDAPLVHEDAKRNILGDFGGFHIGDIDKAFQEADHIFEGEYETPIVHACMLESNISYAYQDSERRIVIVSSCQSPHVCRRIVGQALGVPWGRIKVIKPYIGGGFGNKNDTIQEPLNAIMTLAVGGRPVKLEYTREESMIASTTRHAIKFRMKTGVNRDGKVLGIEIKAFSNTGAYASHGHIILLSGGTKHRPLYNFESRKYEPLTVYTNLPVAGALRGYGAPQVIFALECHMEDIAKKLGLDSITLRKKNIAGVGYRDPLTKVKVLSCGINECIDNGKALIKWDQKIKKYQEQKGTKRKGLGMACFSYPSGTFPASLEIAAARIVLNEDGSVQLQIGATEIGQGSDTIFAQMVAETLGIEVEMVHVISTQDTDISPFDTGSYASRQTFISGMAVRKAALDIKAKILDFVWGMKDIPAEALDIKNSMIVYKHNGEIIISLAEVALATYYDPVFAKLLTSDESNNARINAFSFGTTFVEVEVDILTGKVEIIEIYNVHDSGKIINPKLAEGQVHGGVSMGIGYALSEEMLFDKESGKPLNNNLLDYKLATVMDTPQIGVAFVESIEPTGPFGSKSLGENPTVSPAPAIRNAILNATGISFNKIPITPQRVYEKFKEENII